MIQGLFITGTDTGVGKTRIAAAVLRRLRQRGVDAVPMKPIQTGAEYAADTAKLIAPDLQACLDAAQITPSEDELDLMAPYCYEPACSPHLAGRTAKNYPRISHILHCANELWKRHDVLIVEGAGGIMVPLDESFTMLDLMVQLALPVLLVSRIGLGTINHTLLSIQALRAAGLNLLGVAFNTPESPAQKDRFIHDDNPKTIVQFGGVDILGTVRHSPGGENNWERVLADLPSLDDILFKDTP